jgi:hypothetical protein
LRKKSFKVILVSFLLLLISTSYVFADYSSVHVYLGTIRTSGNDLEYYKDSSIASYGYTSHVDNAVSQWSSASGGVDITSTNDEDCECIAVYAGRYILGSGTYASTGYYDNGFFGWNHLDADDVHEGDNFDRARIRIDDGNMDDAGFTAPNANKTIGHEFGHALGLGHFEDSPSHSGDHWMKSGQISLSAPTSTDKDHLKNKWGN